MTSLRMSAIERSPSAKVSVDMHSTFAAPLIHFGPPIWSSAALPPQRSVASCSEAGPGRSGTRAQPPPVRVAAHAPPYVSRASSKEPSGRATTPLVNRRSVEAQERRPVQEPNVTFRGVGVPVMRQERFLASPPPKSGSHTAPLRQLPTSPVRQPPPVQRMNRAHYASREVSRAGYPGSRYQSWTSTSGASESKQPRDAPITASEDKLEGQSMDGSFKMLQPSTPTYSYIDVPYPAPVGNTAANLRCRYVPTSPQALQSRSPGPCSTGVAGHRSPLRTPSSVVRFFPSPRARSRENIPPGSLNAPIATIPARCEVREGDPFVASRTGCGFSTSPTRLLSKDRAPALTTRVVGVQVSPEYPQAWPPSQPPSPSARSRAIPCSEVRSDIPSFHRTMANEEDSPSRAAQVWSSNSAHSSPNSPRHRRLLSGRGEEELKETQASQKRLLDDLCVSPLILSRQASTEKENDGSLTKQEGHSEKASAEVCNAISQAVSTVQSLAAAEPKVEDSDVSSDCLKDERAVELYARQESIESGVYSDTTDEFAVATSATCTNGMANGAIHAAECRGSTTSNQQGETCTTTAVDAVAAAEELLESIGPPPGERPEPGDVVRLGASVHPSEFRRCPAVVTKVAEAHCTVVVLDEDLRFGIGECWPGLDDVEISCVSWRLDSRVVLSGLKGSRTAHLNGFSGRIAAHPKQGHPTFLAKPSDPQRPQFTLCVRLDDAVAAGKKSVVIEPRFLTPYADHVRRVTGDTLASLATLSASLRLDIEEEPVDQAHRCGGA